MKKSEILKHVDFTNLKPTARENDIIELCQTAIDYKTASVCIPPAFVHLKETYPELNICTVIGFPNGYSTKQVKILEAADAISRGADEIDVVININDVMSENYDKVADELYEIRKASYGKIFKTIIETCYLSDEQKRIMCQIVTDAGCDYIKTSTGFGSAGATLEDIELFKKYIGPNVKMKAAGGIRTREAMEAYLKAGCDRIGASSIDCLINE